MFPVNGGRFSVHTPHHLGYWPTFLLLLVISIPLAWLLSRLISLLIKPLKK